MTDSKLHKSTLRSTLQKAGKIVELVAKEDTVTAGRDCFDTDVSSAGVYL